MSGSLSYNNFFQGMQQYYGLLKTHGKKIIFGSLWLLLSLYAMAHFLASSHLGDRYALTQFDLMLSGEAAKPFVYRVLVPTLTNAIVDITPARLQRAADNSMRRWMVSQDSKAIRSALPWLSATYHDIVIYPRLVASMIIYLSLLGYVYVLYKLAETLMPRHEPLRWFAPVFGLLFIPAFSVPWQYIYDFPVLFLSAACFYTMITGRLKAYMIFFILACLNRETSVFILLMFMLWMGRQMGRSHYLALCVVQLVIYAGIKTVLTYAYMDNPGSFLEFNFARILKEDIFQRADLTRVVVIAGLFFLFTYRWPEKPAFLCHSLWLLPLMYMAYLLYGNTGEYRVFFDLMPLWVLLATHTLTEAAGFARLPFFNPSRGE